MGNESSTSFKSSLDSLTKFDVKTARLVLDRYLALDLPWGLSADDLQRLFRECDLGLGEEEVAQVMAAFPSSEENKEINALYFIQGFAALSKGSFEDKVDLMYDAFDFQKRGEITFDEVGVFWGGLVVDRPARLYYTKLTDRHGTSSLQSCAFALHKELRTYLERRPETIKMTIN